MAKQMTEAQMVGLVRNALLVAGYEMGQTGDHWPMINDTIHSIAHDWQESQIHQNVKAEMKIHLYEQLEIMEKGIADCTGEVKAQLIPKLEELREAYDAYFSPLDETVIGSISDDELPAYVKRAEIIIATLEGDNHG